MIIFHTFELYSLLTLIGKQNKNCHERNHMPHSYHFMQFQYIPLLNLPKNLRKRSQTTKNTWKSSFYVGFSTTPCWSRSQGKLKTIENATKCGTLIVSCNSDKSDSLTCPKIQESCPKQIKILKNDHLS